jgi:3-hydroxybutyrate dehydrogenase
MRAVITGGTGGIGFAIANHFGQAGYQVVLADLNESLLQQKAAELCSQGITADYCVLDVTNQQAIEACAKRFPADILVNNAGIQHVARLEDFPPEKWALLISVMLTGPAMLTRAMLPGMRSNNFGRIINIGSIHAVIASPFKSAYVAAKHGLLGLSKVVALENADKNVTINTICPAYVKTPLVEQQSDRTTGY